MGRITRVGGGGGGGRWRRWRRLALIAAAGAWIDAGWTAPPSYPWLAVGGSNQALSGRFPPPPGFVRAPAAPDSFAAWLRALPLKPPGAPVRLFDGQPKPRQDAHAAVVDIDVGRRDLQQCADGIIRLRAEYLYASGRAGDIVFHFTSGDAAFFKDWAAGLRPEVDGREVRWRRTAGADDSRASFRRYLDVVFQYAGTRSLERELRPVGDRADLRAGDVFLHGGSPGHAVIVVDAASSADGRKVFLLVQGYMPAQDLHVLRNPADAHRSPWYEIDAGPRLATPEWTFDWTELRRFPADR